MLALALVLAAADPQPLSPTLTRVMVADVTGDLDAVERREVSDAIARRLERFPQLRVRRASDVHDGASAGAALVACSDTACRKSIVTDLEVDIVAAARVTRVGATYAVALQLYGADGKAAVDSSATVDGADALASRAGVLANDAGKALTGTDAPPTLTDPASIVDAYRAPLLYGGAGVAGVGVVTAGIALVPYATARGELLSSRACALPTSTNPTRASGRMHARSKRRTPPPATPGTTLASAPSGSAVRSRWRAAQH